MRTFKMYITNTNSEEAKYQTYKENQKVIEKSKKQRLN